MTWIIESLNFKAWRKSYRSRFFLYGFLFGLLFPVIGTLRELFFLGHSLSFGNLVWVQQQSALLWIIDLAPLILGLLAAFAGSQMDRVHEKNIELQEKYDQMSILRKAADNANLTKSSFLANMSHEIRTPMNAIIGLNNLLRKSTLSEHQQNVVEKVDISSRNLLRIIDDILDFSKIEAGKLQLEQSEFSIRKLVDDIVATMQVKAQSKRNVVLYIDIDPKVPEHIMGDPVRLRQVLLNLVDNAVKFTQQGEVRLAVTYSGSADQGVLLRFVVKDSGIGMTPEQQLTIFCPFQQADASTTRRYGGTGLGLSICKNIVEMMDGELNLISNLGQGSQFSFELFFKLPITTKNPADKPNTNAADLAKIRKQLQGKHILLVEDNELNAYVMKDLLSEVGLSCDLAINGKEALSMIYQSTYDAILMDIQMPEMDGFQASIAIRKDHRFQSLPILAVSAHAMKGEYEKSIAAGMNDHITKPIDTALFYCRLVHFIGQTV